MTTRWRHTSGHLKHKHKYKYNVHVMYKHKQKHKYKWDSSGHLKLKSTPHLNTELHHLQARAA